MKDEFEKRVQRIMKRAEEERKVKKGLTPERKGLAGYIESIGLRIEHPYLTKKEILMAIKKDPVLSDVIIMGKLTRRMKRLV